MVGLAKNCWTTPELLIIPPPLNVRWVTTDPMVSPTVTLKGVAPELKIMLSTSIGGNTIERADELETAKVAMSDGLLGTVFGVQLAAVLQSLLVGLRFQVALPACALVPKVTNKKAPPQSRARRWKF